MGGLTRPHHRTPFTRPPLSQTFVPTVIPAWSGRLNNRRSPLRLVPAVPSAKPPLCGLCLQLDSRPYSLSLFLVHDVRAKHHFPEPRFPDR